MVLTFDYWAGRHPADPARGEPFIMVDSRNNDDRRGYVSSIDGKIETWTHAVVRLEELARQGTEGGAAPVRMADGAAMRSLGISAGWTDGTYSSFFVDNVVLKHD